MKLFFVLCATLSTLSAQVDVGAQLRQGLVGAKAAFENVSDKEKDELVKATALLLAKHMTFRPDGVSTSICNSTGRQYVEWKQFVVRQIALQPVTEVQRRNGITRRFHVSFGSTANRSWDLKKSAWGAWNNAGFELFPASILLVFKEGRWSAENDPLKPFTPGPGASVTDRKTHQKAPGLPPGMSRGN